MANGDGGPTVTSFAVQLSAGGPASGAVTDGSPPQVAPSVL